MYQTTTSGFEPADDHAVDNRAMLGVIGFFVGGGLSLIIGLFWAIGAVGLLTGNAGTIVDLGLEGAWRWLYLAYPFVVLGCLVVGTALFALKRHLEAAAIVGLPIVLVTVYYFALVLLR